MITPLDQLVQQLRGSAPPVPFTLELDNASLVCTEILRHLPGKRLVCAGLLGGQRVVAKLYLDLSRAGTHARREEKGARMLATRGVPGPRLVLATAIGKAHAVVYEYIENSSTALDVWKGLTDGAQRQLLICRLAEVIAQHHNAGLVQEDLHLGNFLCAGETIYTLDAAAIMVSGSPISRRPSLQNLALLFAQFPPGNDGLVPAAYARYAQARAWTTTLSDNAQLQQVIEQRRQRREHDYLRKIFRESSAFVSRKRFDHYYVCARSDYNDATRYALEHPAVLFQCAHYLKRGNTSTVAITSVNEQRVVVKRYNIKNLGHGLKRAFRPTRAAISWRNAQRLRFYDIATPRPIALIEHRFGPLRRVSYFVSAFREGESAAAYFGRTNPEQAMPVAQRIVALLRQLRRLNLSHGDLKATNLLICDSEVLLTDLDSLTRHRNDAAAARAHARDLQRFMRNWEGQPVLHALFARLLEEPSADA